MTGVFSCMFNDEVSNHVQKRNIKAALQKEQEWLMSLPKEDAKAYVLIAGVTAGNIELVNLDLQSRIRNQLYGLTSEGTVDAISGSEKGTAAETFGAIVSKAPGIVSKFSGAAGTYANYNTMKSVYDLTQLFGYQHIDDTAEYICASSKCNLTINLKE